MKHACVYLRYAVKHIGLAQKRFSTTAPPDSQNPRNQSEIFESIIDISPKELGTGFILICPTPIGNINDISIRQYEALLNVDIIACEDTRRTGKLFKLLSQRKVREKLSTSFALQVSEVREDPNDIEEVVEDHGLLFEERRKQELIQATNEIRKKGMESLRQKDTLGFLGGVDNSENEFTKGSEKATIYGLDDDFIKDLRERVAETRTKKGRGLFISYHKDNEEARVPRLLRALRYGMKIALVSDSGTPSVSDPGFALIGMAMTEGIAVLPLPGPTSVVTSLSSCGFPSDSFSFLGFLSKTQSEREERLMIARNLRKTTVIFESPHRILQTLISIERIYGGKQVIYIGFELSKLHERHLRGTVVDLYQKLNNPEVIEEQTALKGEAVIVIAPYEPAYNAAMNEKGEITQDTDIILPLKITADLDRMITVLQERLEANDSTISKLLSVFSTDLSRGVIRSRVKELKHPHKQNKMAKLLRNVKLH